MTTTPLLMLIWKLSTRKKCVFVSSHNPAQLYSWALQLKPTYWISPPPPKKKHKSIHNINKEAVKSTANVLQFLYRTSQTLSFPIFHGSWYVTVRRNHERSTAQSYLIQLSMLRPVIPLYVQETQVRSKGLTPILPDLFYPPDDNWQWACQAPK